MLLSAVITLKAQTAGAITQGTGRGVHGYFFHQWKHIAPEIGDRLHTDSQTSPYTISPLIGLFWKKGQAQVSEGDLVCLRVTSLDNKLSHALLDTWLPKLPEWIEIGGIRWKLDKVFSENGEHPWAGRSTYKTLASQRLNQMQPPRRWRFRFETHTAFHGTVGHFPFPLPDSLITSWLRRWQDFSPIGLPEDLSEQVRNGFVISGYDLRTLAVKEGQRTTIGCVGRMNLSAMKQPPSTRAAVDLLAHYAFYCGSGHRTTQGMGQTKLLN